MTTKILNCKAKPPIEGIDIVADQISAAHRYYNKLVELHRAFADAADDLKRKHIPGLIEAEAATTEASEAVDALRAKIKSRNAQQRKLTAGDDDREAVTEARRVLRDCRATVKQLRATATESADYQADMGRLVIKYHGTLDDGETRRKGGLFKEARSSCGVYSGTYLRIEAAVEQAKNTSFGRPAFRRWNGDGLVGPQLTPALTVSELLQRGDSRLRVEFLPGPIKRAQRLLFWVRVASDEAGKPIWCKIPAYMSRGQLPDDAQIKWATIVRRQVGVRRHRDPVIPEGVYKPYYEWSVQLTISTDVEKQRSSSGACGINIGWRAMADGSLRVATVVGDDGVVEDLRLPKKMVERWGMADGIRSHRDLNFDAARDALASWIAGREVPEWMIEATKLLTQWRSARRLGGVQGQWAAKRFDGDSEAFAAITEWRERDVHLEQYELMLRRKAARARLEYYRQFAARIRIKYRTIAIDDTKQKQLIRTQYPERNEATNDTARYNAMVAAPSSLRQLFAQDGSIKMPAANITNTCHGCGTADEWDHQANLSHECSNCSTVWDQDENAARNLLAAVIAASAKVVDKTPAPARETDYYGNSGDAPTDSPGGGKWARRKAARSQKAGKIEPAQEA